MTTATATDSPSPAPADLAPGEKDRMFRRLLADYGRALHHFVLRRVGNEDDAADIAQQALVEASFGLHRFRGESSVSTWVFGIALNLVRNHLGRAPHRRHVFESSDVLEMHPAPDADPFEIAERRELLERVSGAIGALSPDMSQALMLVSVEGLSYDEAATRLVVPVGTLRSRVSRARAAVRASVCGRPTPSGAALMPA